MFKSNADIKRTFADKGLACNLQKIPFEDTDIQLIEAGVEDSEVLVLFIHGAPGSSSDFLSYMTDTVLYNKVHMISVDRLGYGGSHYGVPYPHFDKQISGIKKVLYTYSFDRLVIVSHSYGGPIGVLLASELDIKVDTHIALAPVVSADDEPYSFIMKVPSLPIVENLFSGAMRVSSHEKAIHREQLREYADQMLMDSCHTLVIHGKKDMIAPYQNAQYLFDKSPDHVELMLLEDENHFIPWSQYDLVKNSLLKAID